MLLDSNSKRINLLTDERRSSFFNKSFEYEAYILESVIERYSSPVFNESFQKKKRKNLQRERDYFIYDRSI